MCGALLSKNTVLAADDTRLCALDTPDLPQVFHASPKLAAIRTVDEAIVIGAALSLSSSAFVLQLMAEKGQLATKFGSATLGILLLQVCPFS